MSTIEKYGCGALLICVPLAAVARVAALVWLWAWFVEPLGAPGVGAWQAFGLATLCGLLVPSAPTPQVDAWIRTLSSEERGKIVAKQAFRMVMTPVVALAFGYAAHWCAL